MPDSSTRSIVGPRSQISSRSARSASSVSSDASAGPLRSASWNSPSGSSFAMFFTRLNATASFLKSGDPVNSGRTSSSLNASEGFCRSNPFCCITARTLRTSKPRRSSTYR